MLHGLLFRIRTLFRRRGIEAELEDELHFHRQQQLEKYLGAGLNPAEARRRVRLDFEPNPVSVPREPGAR